MRKLLSYTCVYDRLGRWGGERRTIEGRNKNKKIKEVLIYGKWLKYVPQRNEREKKKKRTGKHKGVIYRESTHFLQ